MKILVLLSGGLDSAVVLAALVKQGHDCAAIGFDYGQRNVIELEAAEAIADHYKVAFETLDILPGVPLVNDVVYAGRNLLIAALAIAQAQARGFEAIAVGCNESDWQEFPDCRPPFWRAVRSAAEAYDVEVLTPLINAWKAVIVQTARELGVPIELTWSCYDPIMDPEHGDHRACGACLACKTREEALKCSVV